MTYAELTQLIQDYTENSETSFVDNIPNIIVQAESRVYHNVRSPDQRTLGFASLVAGDSTFITNSDFIEPIYVTVDTSSTPLLLKSPSLIQTCFPSSGTRGTPIWYGIQTSNAEGTSVFVIGPPVDVSTEVTYWYIGNPSSITTTATHTTWLSIQFPEVLLYGCLLEAQVYCKFTNDQIAMFQSRFDAGMAALVKSCEKFQLQDEYNTSPISPQGVGAEAEG